MIKPATIASLALLAATSVASGQCLVESLQAPGATDVGQLVMAGESRVGYALQTANASVSLLRLLPTGFVETSGAGYVGPVDAIDADGTRYGTIWDFGPTFLAPGAGADFGVAVAVDASPSTVTSGPRYDVGHPGFNGGSGAVHAYTFEASLVTNLGSGHPGSSGTPALTSGPVCEFAGSIDLTLSGMLPGSVATLVIGVAELNAPFKGGTLVPASTFLIDGLPTLGGTLPVSGPVPFGLTGFPLVLQAWIVDAGASNGVSATNAVRIDLGT